MTLEVIDFIEKYRSSMMLNIGELKPNTKQPKVINGKIPYHNEINENNVSLSDGLCVFCGVTSLNLMIIDIDDHKLFDDFKEYLEKTFVVKSGKKGYHIYFRTYENPKSRSLTNEKGQHIDILGQGKIGVLPPSIHIDTKKPYEIISDKKIKQLTRTEEEGLFKKLQDLGFAISSEKKPINELHSKDFIKFEGQNRAEDLLRVIDSWKIKNPELTESMLFGMAKQYSIEHFESQYTDDKIKAIVKQGFEFGKKIISEKESKEQEKKLNKTNDLIDKTADKIQKKFNLVTNRQNKEILLYSGKIYQKDSSSQAIIEEEVEDIIDNCTTHERNEVVNKLKARTGQDLDSFDSNPYELSLLNGILDVNVIEKHDHTPKHLSSVLIPVNYSKPIFEIHDETIFDDIEKNLKETLFWKFLKDSFTVDEEFMKEDFESVLEITASFFIKKQIDEKAFMFLGRGENGKSVLTEYIINMVGLDNVEKISLQALSEDKFMSARLVGKMANIFSDLNDSSLSDTGIIKNVTSMEGIEAQHKHGHPFVLHPFCKLLFSCNRFPKVKNDQTQGFFRRWIIIKWRRNFENDPVKDEHLKDKLRDNPEERDLVFSSLVHLTRLLLRNGKFSHSKDWKETQEEWNANADPLNDFVETCIIDSEGNRGVRETYKFYRQMMVSRQETPLGIAKFGMAFKEYFDQQVTRDSKIVKDDDGNEKKVWGKSERVWLNIDFIIPKVNDYNTK
jgi:P4 family phage/plasmid primase-like protien